MQDVQPRRIRPRSLQRHWANHRPGEQVCWIVCDCVSIQFYQEDWKYKRRAGRISLRAIVLGTMCASVKRCLSSSFCCCGCGRLLRGRLALGCCPFIPRPWRGVADYKRMRKSLKTACISSMVSNQLRRPSARKCSSSGVSWRRSTIQCPRIGALDAGDRGMPPVLSPTPVRESFGESRLNGILPPCNAR
jgi:hypothetical protein